MKQVKYSEVNTDFKMPIPVKMQFRKLISTVLKGNENKSYTMSIFLDLSKAFDTISHTVLFSKLHKYGIRGTCLDWYRSYLNNRMIRVKCITLPVANRILRCVQH